MNDLSGTKGISAAISKLSIPTSLKI